MTKLGYELLLGLLAILAMLGVTALVLLLGPVPA